MSLVSTNKIDATKYELEIKIDAEGFEKAVQNAYMKARKRISVNGFRKGKAPRKMIEQIYGENVFYEDAVNSLVNTDVASTLEETDYELVANPEINVTSINKADGVMFKVVITVKPEVEISDYKGIEVEKVVNAVTDEDVDKQIQALRERNGRLVTVDDRAAENGDVAVIDFEGFKDGVPFDGGKDENYELALGSNTFIPGFEEQIVGKKTGEEFTINVTFPENYQMEEIAGQLCEFKIRLNEIKSKELPDLDDEFVKDATEFDTLDELKDDIRTKLEDSAARNADIEAEHQLYESLI
ncbi:MAG: trigger factor, partial [Oscillospiraceae bacterium]|nr:trigger factor [Oscillospiraceae bacterium]